MFICWKSIPLFLGENVQEFFFRVAALAFEKSILKDMENGAPSSIGHSDSISKTSHPYEMSLTADELKAMYKKNTLIFAGSDRAILEQTANQEAKKSCCWREWTEERAEQGKKTVCWAHLWWNNYDMTAIFCDTVSSFFDSWLIIKKIFVKIGKPAEEVGYELSRDPFSCCNTVVFSVSINVKYPTIIMFYTDLHARTHTHVRACVITVPIAAC